jgi:hypothetical protein
MVSDFSVSHASVPHHRISRFYLIFDKTPFTQSRFQLHLPLIEDPLADNMMTKENIVLTALFIA